MNQTTLEEYMLAVTDVHQVIVQSCAAVRHDPEAHNTCVLIVENGYHLEAFWSYSNVSGLPAAVKRRLRDSLIPPGLPPNSLLTSVGPMFDAHTERRLLNYVEATGKLKGNATFITTRDVCPSCQKGIWEAQTRLAERCALRAFQLGAQDRGRVLESATLMTFANSSDWRRRGVPEPIPHPGRIRFV